MKYTAFDMNLLKVLAVLFEERSVTRAGQRLGRTQSAISNSLKKLRETLEDPLLVRGPDGLILTPRAIAIEEQVRSIISMTESCLTDVATFDPSSARGVFRIGTPDRLTLPVLSPLMKSLRAKAPDISVELITTDRQDALALVDADKLDIAIGWFDHAPVRFNASLLFREDFVWLCRQGHPVLEGRRPIDLAAILSYPHVVVSAASSHKAVFDIMLERMGQRRQIAITVTNFSLVPKILNESNLIGVYTQRVAKFLAREFGLVASPLPIAVEPLDHYLVWHKRYSFDKRHLWLIEQVLKACL